MENLYFNDFEDLACSVADTYDSLKGKDYEDVAIIAKYEEARQIIKELLCIGYDIHSINIIDEEYGEYDAEYIISIYDDEIWCEQMLRENGYLTDDSPVMYVLDNCSSKVIPYCKGKTVYEVSVGIDEDDECGCDECECACKKDIYVETDGDMHGFSVNHSGENGWSSYSFYSTNMDLVNINIISLLTNFLNLCFYNYFIIKIK